MTGRQLERLLRPRHIAFIGGRSLEPAIANCEQLGFTGDIWVVNPQHDRIGGRPCVASVPDLPVAPDAAFVGVGRELTIEVVGQLAAQGAGGCVCLAAGFAETGSAGRDLQDRLATAAGRMPLMGPNCYGFLNYLDGVALWPDLHGGRRVDAGVAFVAQSGNLSLNATMADRSVPLSHVLSIGNQAVTGFATYVNTLLDDPRVHGIGLYVEGIPDLTGFEAAARRALERGVPLFALRSGSSAVAASVAEGHTGSRPDVDERYRSVFERCGVTEVASLSAMLETLKLCALWARRGASPSIAAVGASGGDLAILADLTAATPLWFPSLSGAAVAGLRRQLGDLVVVDNPLDHNTAVWGDHDALVSCFSTVMREDVGCVVLVIDFPSSSAGDPGAWDVSIDAFVAAHEAIGRRAAVVSTLPEGLPRRVRDRLIDAGIAPLQGLADAVTALAAMARYPRWRDELLTEGATHA